MKTARPFCIILLALTTALLIYQPAAALPIVEPVRLKCLVRYSRDLQKIDRIDIPSHRGDYAVLDRVGNCTLDLGPIMLTEGFPQMF